MGIGQSKEGFSVFGIFNQCVSPQGKRLLRLWFRRPIINLAAIQDRQASICSLSLRFPFCLQCTAGQPIHDILCFGCPHRPLALKAPTGIKLQCWELLRWKMAAVV